MLEYRPPIKEQKFVLDVIAGLPELLKLQAGGGLRRLGTSRSRAARVLASVVRTGTDRTETSLKIIARYTRLAAPMIWLEFLRQISASPKCTMRLLG